MRAPAAGASSRCGATRRGCSNVLNAFRSGAGQRLAGEHARRRDVSPLEHQLALALEVAVQHQHARLAVLRVERGDDVDERHLIVAGEVGLQPGGPDRIGLGLDAEVEHAAARVAQRPGVRVVGALPQHAGVVGHERRDDVDQLRQAADADAIGVAQQRVDEAADEQRVLEVVDLLEQLRRELPPPVHRVAAAGPVPDVPFVERQPQALARLAQPLHVVADGRHLANLAIHVEVHRQVARGAVAGQRPRCCRSRRAARCRPPGRSTPPALRDPRPGTVGMPVPLDPQAISCSLAIDDAHLLRRRRAPCARTRAPAAGRSASCRPSRCPGTSSARCAASRSRATAAGRSTSCRARGCSTRRRRPPSPRVPVPKFMPSSGSVPTSRHQSMNSLVPNWFVSIEFHARSSTVGRCAFGPTPSSQL